MLARGNISFLFWYTNPYSHKNPIFISNFHRPALLALKRKLLAEA